MPKTNHQTQIAIYARVSTKDKQDSHLDGDPVDVLYMERTPTN